MNKQQVKCNNCDWQGDESQLKDDGTNELCPKCGMNSEGKIMDISIKDRLEYLRGELEAERMSYGELAELQSLAEHIAPDDVRLLEAAGVDEFRRCHLCDGRTQDKYCINSTCAEYTKNELIN